MAEGPRPGTAIARGKSHEALLVERDRVVWRAAATTGNCPVPPVPAGDGRWLIAGDRGDISLVAPLSGDPPPRHRLFSGGYLLATPDVVDGVAFVGSQDGTVTALALPPGSGR